MKIKHLVIGVTVLIAGGNIYNNSTEYSRAHPIVYTAEAREAEKVVLIATTTSEKTIEEKIRATFYEDPETAMKIAKCESNLNPSAVNNRNKNGTIDGGIFQINSVHDKRLDELGLDKFNADDNIKFARILWEEHKWKPWACRKLI